MTFIVSVEGNIGSGKSTFLKHLKKYSQNNEKYNIVFVQEPVDEWNNIRDSTGKNILEMFYADQEANSFSFQIMAYITRLKKLLDVIKNGENQLIICERSLETDKYVFAKMLYDSKKIREIDWVIYNYWFDTFLEEVETDMTIYINTSSENCYNRIKKRSRSGESSIPIEYLQDCQRYHEDWLKEININVKTINGNTEITSEDSYINLVKNTLELIKNRYKSTASM